MKSKVLDRPMFKKSMMAVGMAPVEEVDPENVGIMSGFKDMLDDLELPEDEENGEERQAEKMLDRTPDSPEILMNNLRGDMRSVDARVEELADLVGYNAAADTPESVLALLQPVLAAQQAPMAPPMMPPGMPPAMPPGLPPGMEAAPPMPPGPPPMPPGGIASLGAGAPPPMPAGGPPLQMAKGGIVQRFRNGSDEEGVTASGGVTYPQSLLELATRRQMDLLSKQPLSVPDLETQVAVREPLYRQLLGAADKGVTQGQMLFDIAQGGLNLAAGVDAEGRPLRGPQSAVSRFASAFSKVPGQIGARAAEMQKDERALRLAALQAAEKDIANIREQNVKLQERQEKTLAEIIKAGGQSVFGKADWALSIVTRPGFVDRWKEGKLNDNEQKLMDAAIADFSTPTYENRVDPVTSQPFSVARYKPLPKFLENAMNELGVPVPPKEPQIIAGQGVGVGTGTAVAKAIPPKTPPPIQWSAMQPSMFNASKAGTGALFNVPLAFAEKVPIVNAFVDANQNIEATTFLRAAAGQVNRSLATNPRFAEGERKQIQKDIELLPALIDNPEAYQQRLISIDSLLRQLRNKYYANGYENPNLGPQDIRDARLLVSDLDSTRELLGLPPRVEDFPNIEAFNRLPVGHPFIKPTPKGPRIFYKDR